MTPLYKIILPESKGRVYAKMERFNPTGTHKDRSLGPWILYYKKGGEKEFAIPSSGNSAIAAARICDELGLRLHVFIGENTGDDKLERLKKYKSVSINISKNPRKDSIRFAREEGIVNLRSSTDDKALDGYKSIAYELKEELTRIDNLFIPTSSGSTLEGIYIGYKEMGLEPPALWAIQTAKVHPIAGYFDKNFREENESHAAAIVDNIAHRRSKVIEIIKGAGGGGYVVSNDELEGARGILEKSEFEWPGPGAFRSLPGWQSALSFAGFLRRSEESKNENNSISVCLFTD